MGGFVEEIVCGSSKPQEPLRVIGGMIPNPPRCLSEIVSSSLGVNLGDPSSYPGLQEAVERVVGFASRASTGREYPGWPTSGATESNILALLHAREDGYRTVIHFATAHYSIAKAIHLLGLKEVLVRVIDGYAPDLAALEQALEEHPGSIVVATLGTTETGYLDPVGEIARLAGRYDSIVHVDAAFTGPILSVLPNPKANVQLDSIVRTMAVDLHKIPEAPIGAGVLLASSKSIIDGLWYNAPYIPSGRQFGLLGTRPALPILAAAYIAEKLEPHIKTLADKLMDAAYYVYDNLVGKGPYGSPHPPESPLVCLTHRRHRRIHSNLLSLGYRAYKCPSFGGVRLAIMPHTLGGVLEHWVKLLRAAAREAS
jgi:tyrosine decarboxylase/aspartate 1-decarboxylase